ncbi:MAG: hypothetical protein AAB066_00345 [Candidatus Margulisiibacteriota bacterium]
MEISGQIGASFVRQVQSHGAEANESGAAFSRQISELTDEMKAFANLARDQSKTKVNDQAGRDKSAQQQQLDQQYRTDVVLQQSQVMAEMAQHSQHLAGVRGANELDQLIAALISEMFSPEEATKLRKKQASNKTPFGAKLEQLLQLEAEFKQLPLSEDERRASDQFFDYLHRFDHLKKRLRQLDIMENQAKANAKRARAAKQPPKAP